MLIIPVQLADHGRTHPEDPDELQSVDGQSETSDVRLEGEELLVPSQQRAMERPRQQQEAAAAESPKPAKAQSRQNLELPHRSLSTRIGSPREASGRTPGSTRGASRLSMQQVLSPAELCQIYYVLRLACRACSVLLFCPCGDSGFALPSNI